MLNTSYGPQAWDDQPHVSLSTTKGPADGRVRAHGLHGRHVEDLLGPGSGKVFATLVLGAWIAAPVATAVWIFRRKDL